MENEQKFPANQMKIAGRIVETRINEAGDKLNVTIATPAGEGSSKYLKALVSGKDRIEKFNSQYNEAKANLPEVHAALTGTAHFSSYNGNDNCTLILIDKLEKQSENLIIPKNETELNSFQERFHSRSEEINSIKIIGVLGDNPQIKTANNEQKTEFGTFSVAHNFTGADGKPNAMWANVVVPSSKIDTFKETNISKGNMVKLEGAIQPKVYEKEGNKVYTFNVISKNVIPDLSKLVNKEQDQKQESSKEVKAEKAKSTAKTTAEKKEKTKGM